jgi:hypothetical protein
MVPEPPTNVRKILAPSESVGPSMMHSKPFSMPKKAL